MIIRQTQGKMKNKSKKLSFSLCPLQTTTHLPPATVGLLSLPSFTTNLHTIHKTFTKALTSIEKSNFSTHPRYAVTIEKF